MGKCVSHNFWTPIFIFVILIWIVARISLLSLVCDLEYLLELAQLRLLADVIANIVDDVVPTYMMPWQMLLPYYPL